ncbi:MAG: VIT1/CCC1 transporter family protein [Treponema sp.]|jgi:VIT1/CCC1 family predicted Fe2+/Mn2+ transporter|nr:VIT1/CCC1 transporter family protein [Treponema sp.]
MKTLIADEKIARAVLAVQRNEVTECLVYTRLAAVCRDPSNAEVLRIISEEEFDHSKYWKSKTGVDVKPDRVKAFFTVLLARVFGLTFCLKRMEKNEGVARKTYDELVAYFPEAKKISDDEAEHEQKMLNLLDEELLHYVGSIVLGLNDALVELTGALAGFTLALGGTRLISLAGLVTGISAAFSMGASDYLSGKAEGNPRAARSALYTGGAYIVTVVFLILPFLLLSSKFAALAVTLSIAVFIIFIFNYYLATAKELNFVRRFLEMTFISLGVAALSFGVGFILKGLLGV